MKNHSSNNNTNKNQVDPKIIRDQLSEWKKYIKAEEKILEVTAVLLKHKIISFDDVEQLKHDQDRNFLNENKFITCSILCNAFNQFGDKRTKEEEMDILKNSIFGSSRETTLLTENDINTFLNLLKKDLMRKSNPSDKDLQNLKKQYLSSYFIPKNIDENNVPELSKVEKLMCKDKEMLAGWFIVSEVQKQKFNACFAKQSNKDNYRNNVIKQYPVNISILKDNIYKTYELIKILNQQLEITRLYLLPTPNHVHKATNKKQTGRLEELDKKDQDARALLKQKILEDPYLSEDEKNSAIEKVNVPSTNALFELDRYLGSKLEPKVNIVLRAIRAIVFEAVQSKKAESPHHPIKFSTNKLYELCGVKKHAKGGYHSEQTKNIISIITRSSLTEKILVKNEYNKIIKSTSFILESTFHSNKVEIKKNRKKELLPESIIQEQVTHITIKVSDFLFANHINQLENSYLQDVEGYIRFKKLNDTTIGNQLFLWLEIYLSRVNKIKEVNLNTIVKELMLEERYKSHPKEVKNSIERALKEMIELKTLIKDYKLAIGAKGQEKYILTNARYLEKPKLEVINTKNKKSIKSKK